MKRLHFRVYGTVQGIGYRFFVIREAEILKLSGTVRNLPDGGVEGEAQGPMESLKKFVSTLEKKHYRAVVEKIETDYYDDIKPYRGFNIEL